jgi:hypothetical protein
VNNELDMMWNESIMACLKVLYRHSLGETEGNHEKSEYSAFQPRFEPAAFQIQVRSVTAWAKFFGHRLMVMMVMIMMITKTILNTLFMFSLQSGIFTVDLLFTLFRKLCQMHRLNSVGYENDYE